VPTSSADVADAPYSDASSGVAIKEKTSIGRKLLWVPRVALYLPKQVVRLAFAPVRGASYLWGKYQVGEQFHDAFYNEADTFGVVPVVNVDSGFGINGGARIIASDLFGASEYITLRASFGGRYEQLYSASLASGNLFGRVSLGVEAGYEQGFREPFHGIGNGDLVDRDMVMSPINALSDDTAVKSRFKQDLTYVKVPLRAKITEDIKIKLSTELRYQEFRERQGDDDTFNIYQRSSLISLEDGTSDVYTQLKLSYDNRQNTDRYVDTVIGPGLYAGAWLGYAKGFDDDPSNHLRYALDLQGVINLWRGDRLLILRGLVDGVTAKLNEIPFADLPELGGARLLRGYETDRFRDRAHTLASAEYQFNLTEKSTAFLFTDAGRVWRTLKDVELEGIRMGYGGGLILQSNTSFIARLQLASSIDGGLFFNFALDPVYEPQAAREAQE
jgi:outer membrane protein assembly factor BamA